MDIFQHRDLKILYRCIEEMDFEVIILVLNTICCKSKTLFMYQNASKLVGK